ncbi:mevalonate kinase [Candidatus Daviesbacteria bacterium]|nr:mevalonate kinase [Candidatus Daviesbacteria bacterium]
MIKFSAPGKIHLLGEHSVVYGKPALIAAVNLRLTVTIQNAKATYIDPTVEKYGIRKIVESIVKKAFKIKHIPPYKLEISSQLPIGAGLGSSAASSAAYITALLSFLKIKWDLNLINNLAYEAERVFHGNPSGGDNSTVVFGGLIWFRKEDPSLKLIQPLQLTIPTQLAKNFVLINTGTPKETTLEMVTLVKNLYKKRPNLVEKFLTNQESLVRQLLNVIKECNEKEFIKIIKAGEQNLESIGVVSPLVKPIIRKIEQAGGAAKICGAGGKTGPTGILLAYHQDKSKLENIAKSFNLSFFSTALGVEGIDKMYI